MKLPSALDKPSLIGIIARRIELERIYLIDYGPHILFLNLRGGIRVGLGLSSRTWTESVTLEQEFMGSLRALSFNVSWMSTQLELMQVESRTGLANETRNARAV